MAEQFLTLMADLEYNGKALRVMGLHSITGISHKRAKSMQFLSFAESIDEFKPDIVVIIYIIYTYYFIASLGQHAGYLGTNKTSGTSYQYFHCS